MPTKLHELLAARPTLAQQADATRNDLAKTFKDKRHHFEETVVQVNFLRGERAPETEKQTKLETTVAKELSWITGILKGSIDTAYQIDVANTAAKADITLDSGEVIATGVPATALLQLEKRLDEFFKLLQAAPTLDPAKGFTRDETREAGVYVSREEKRQRTEKVQEPIVLYPATPEHPAQTQLISKDVPVAEAITKHWSGMLTIVEKGSLLERTEALRVAVKKANARANNVDVDTKQVIAGRLFQYVLSGTVAK